MKKFAALLALLSAACLAASARDGINPGFEKLVSKNPARASLNECPYDYVYEPLRESKVPKGYKAFYISHYGRHGSRSDWNPHNYSEGLFILRNAKHRGILSAAGDSLLNELQLVIEGMNEMGGRLTPRGLREHREIAGRMFGRYPQVFKSGSRTLRVLSSTVPRCIMSMSAFTGRLQELCPGLEINSDCGEVLQKVVSNSSAEYTKAPIRATRDSLARITRVDVGGLMGRIFTDTLAARELVPDTRALARIVYDAGRISRSFDYGFDMHRFLPFGYVCRKSELTSMYMYLSQCNSLPFGDSRMIRAQPLIWDIVDKADEAISGGGVNADLRFGHDFPLLAACSFFRLEGVGERYSPEEAMRSFDAGEHCPFAANLQLIFYRSGDKDKPVLVKFLLNEAERKIIGLTPVEGPYYRWNDVKAMLAETYPSRFIGPLQGRRYRDKDRKESYQGMDIWNGSILSLQNSGAASVYRIEGDSIRKLSDFLLGSENKRNHCNVASFLPEFYDPSDPFPLVCVSRCHKQKMGEFKDEAFIERISPGLQGSSVVATINYDDTGHDFGYALQWVVDREEKMLYGYGNTIDNKNPENRHRIIKFRLPEIKGNYGKVINLKSEDALENYLVEDYWSDSLQPVGQGLFVRNGKLYIPTGLDTEAEPSRLYVWDLARKTMKVFDLGAMSFGEPEDCSIYDGKFWLQTQGGIFRMPIKD